MSKCNHPEHSFYPLYGVAPHECYWRKPGGFEKNPLGTSTILPLDNWPENFLLVLEDGDTIETYCQYGACGVYFCPVCKDGIEKSRVLPSHFDAKKIIAHLPTTASAGDE